MASILFTVRNEKTCFIESCIRRKCLHVNQLYKKLNSQLSPHDASKQLSLSDFAGDPLGKSHN